MTPGCNSFAKDRNERQSLLGGSGGTIFCHLKAHCAMPGSEETTLPTTTLTLKPHLRARFLSHYKWPCSSETSEFPQPGVRRALPSLVPTGLASFDCVRRIPSSN